MTPQRKALPEMSAETAQLLRVQFAALPPLKVRWRTQPGDLFLIRLAELADIYSVPQCATVLSVSVSTVYDWLNRRLAGSSACRWPKPDELRPLRRAWRVMEGLRKSGRHAGRQTPEYENVHLALMALTKDIDLTVLAAAMREPAQALKAFLPPPQYSADDRADTAELINLWQRVHHSRRSSNAVLASERLRLAVQQANTRMSASRIARALGVTLHEIHALLEFEESG